MIWVGTYRWDLKSRPIFIPNFAEKWDPFLYQSHKFLSKIYQKFLNYLSKLLSFQSKFQNFCYQIDEIRPIFVPILEKIENVTHVYTSFCSE